ncbi:hypothetical protein [Planctopirus hydrillae]|uniref:Uncharacterized protein n=1 Tax=Planctopirus hydrillae TaxID=1841610 RepID=A0A1C3ENT0_9PLAN|nr:hypothetical protein [Planctopirus hydrillae]ODA34913.1 hypothetical protein A6X21_04525 [Planctopirus hydrillae]
MWGTSWGERAHTFWLVVAGCVMASVFANRSNARSEEPVRRANSIRKGVVSALDLENAPKKIFLKEFQHVLARRANSGNRVIEFTRFNYDTVFERQSCEHGVLAVVGPDNWIMATRPVDYTASQIRLRKGCRGEAYQVEKKKPEFLSFGSDHVFIAAPETQECSFVSKTGGLLCIPYLLRDIEQPHITLLTWPWPDDDVLLECYVNRWDWRISDVNESRIRFHAERRYAEPVACWKAIELIVDRTAHRIEALKLVSYYDSREVVYVVSGESRNINFSRYPFLEKFEKPLSRRNLPSEEDFLKAGYRIITLPEVSQTSVSALEPANVSTAVSLPAYVRSCLNASAAGQSMAITVLHCLLRSE